MFSRGGTAFAVLAPRAAEGRSVPLRSGKGKGLVERLARLKAKKGLMGAVHADVMFIKADGSTVSFSFDRGSVTAASDTSVTLEARRRPERHEEHLRRHEAPRQARRRWQGGGVLEGRRGDAILAAGPKA